MSHIKLNNNKNHLRISSFLLLLLLAWTILTAQAEHHQYISDRLCNRIYTKLQTSNNNNNNNSSNSLAQLLPNQTNTTTTSQHTGAADTPLAYLNQRDGVKYPFWVQCGSSSYDASALYNTTTTTAIKTTTTTTTTNQQSKKLSDSENDLSSIFDDWASDLLTDESLMMMNGNLSHNTKRRRPNSIRDDRYDYLTSVVHHCRIEQHVRSCSYFKIGLYNQQDSRCPACGLNDLNCDNVNQCTSDCGQIKSINYPLNYGNNHRCRWSIRAPNGFYVNLSVIDFDIPSANNATKLGTCIFDYLTLIDGYTGKRIGCYCNDHLPPAYIVSPWNELIIQFDTNSEITGRGFYFQYQFMKLELNERVNLHLGVVGGCLAGWQYFRGSCYKAYNEVEPLQWYDAENKCNYLGEGLDGHLVSILDKDEMLVISYWLTNVWNSTRYREYYIGLIDVSREGLYRWSDNNPMSYTDWELKPMLLEDETPAQPDGGAYEDCTVIRYNSFSRTSNWHDVPCSLGKHFHSHLDKSTQIKFKWDYVSSYICKSDSMSLTSTSSSSSSSSGSNLPSLSSSSSTQASISLNTSARSKIRRPLFSNEFKPPLQTDHLISHLSGGTNQRNSNAIQLSSQLSSQVVQSSSNNNSSAFYYLSKLDDNRYFICDNLEVISTVLRCDGVAHCRDGSDESNGCDQECLDWQFKCANGRCISVGYYCDFSDDCGDGSDESRCERHRCKLNEFRCQSGQCITAQQRCDLLPDCRDSSDEGRSCTIGSNCNSASTFQCYNGLCIPQYAVCDFQIDCPGKFHEDEDATTCELLLQKAGLNSSARNQQVQQVQPESLLVQRSGEVVFYPATQAASSDSLSESLFKCKSGNTIDASQRCLFEFDRYGFQLGCRDVSHLVDCNDFECPQRDYVKCPNGYCIPWRYVCDGKWDCMMGDDEVGCARYVCPGQYKCANQSSCILLHQLCDGHRQCPMGDDEWFCDLQCPLGCDCIGQSVNCRAANLISLPSNYILKSVRKLDLSYNKLGPSLSNSNFDAYHDLGELILSHNEIEVLTPRKFHQLRNLYKLDLSYNQIHSVKRGAFAGLRRVTQLLLESNQQLFLLEPEAFLGLSSLQMLNISSSRIQSLRKNTFDGLTSLRHLQLRSNMILTVEDGAFRSLSSLVSLDMRGNDIKHFTKLVFTELKSLRNLSTDSFKFCCLMNHQIPADKCLPLPDEISDCEDLLSSVPQRACIFLAGAIACLGNAIVICYRCTNLFGPKEREVEHVNSRLLLSLGISDLFMGIYALTIFTVDAQYRGIYIENADKWRESPLCNLCGFLSTISSTVSVLTLVFIAYNRYLEICKPFEMDSKFTLNYTCRLIRLSWLLALTIASLPLIIWPYFKGQFYAKSGVCLAFHITGDQRTAGWLYSNLVSPCVNLTSFLFILKCYLRIYGEISRAARRNEHAERSNHQVKIIMIILTHFVAFSPPMILGFMSLAGYTPPAALYSWIAVLVLPVNSAINPMIYTIPNIRHEFRQVFRNWRAHKSNAWARHSGGGGSNAGAAPTAANQSRNGSAALTPPQPPPPTPKELVPMLRADANLRRLLAKRNIPPGYVAVSEYFRSGADTPGSHQVDVSHLVDIALEIARDLEAKHRDAKVYASLRLEDIYVSLTPLPVGTLANLDNPQNKISVFVADHDGYRHKRSAACSHVGVAIATTSGLSGNESGRHHKTAPNCECADVTRFGDILFKLIQLYNNHKSH